MGKGIGKFLGIKKGIYDYLKRTQEKEVLKRDHEAIEKVIWGRV